MGQSKLKKSRGTVTLNRDQLYIMSKEELDKEYQAVSETKACIYVTSNSISDLNTKQQMGSLEVKVKSRKLGLMNGRSFPKRNVSDKQVSKVLEGVFKRGGSAERVHRKDACNHTADSDEFSISKTKI